MRAGVSFSTGAQIMHTADCKPFSGELLGFSGNLKRPCFRVKTGAFFVHDTRARNGVSILSLCCRLLGAAGGVPACRAADQQGTDDQHGGRCEADRVGEQDRLERPVHREDGLDPEDAHAAHAEERQNGRGE